MPARTIALATCLVTVAVGCKSKPGRATEDAPAIAATGTLEEPRFEGYRAQLLADGTLLALEKDGIRALAATGKLRWHVAMAVYDWMLPLADGSLLVTDTKTHELVALDTTTGAEVWRTAIPSGDEDGVGRNAEAAVVSGNRVVVALEDARFLRVDPKACRARKPCVELAFQLPDEMLTDPHLLATPDGGLLVGESEMIRQLDGSGQTRVRIRVRDTLGGFVLAPSGKLAAVMDDELVLFDLAGCAGAGTIALPRKPGRMYVKGEGDCDDCARPAASCLVVRPELGDVDANSPVVLADGSIVVTTDNGIAKVKADGTKAWTSELSAFGTLRPSPAGLVALMSTVGDDLADAPARVVAIDPDTGKPRWQRTLAFKTGIIVSTGDMILDTNGPWIVAGYKGAVAWLRGK